SLIFSLKLGRIKNSIDVKISSKSVKINANIKNFGSKYKTVVKPIKKQTEENNINMSNDSKSSSSTIKSILPLNTSNKLNEFMARPKYNEKVNDASGMNLMSKFDDNKLKAYYS